jgi:heat shock protein HslJ
MLTGCGSQSSSTPAAAAPASSTAVTALAGTSWNLASYAGPDGTEVPAVQSGDPGSLTFATDGTFAGSTGCNRILGTYVQDGSSLTITSGPMTLMACPDTVAAQETAVVAALPKVASFTSGTSLVLIAADGKPLLTYSPGLASLAGTSWQATGINNGKDAVVGMAGTEKVTAVFGADGQLSGSGGCNTYSSTFTTTGADQIALGPIAATQMACPDAGSQIEQEYFAALGNVTTFQLEANHLTLRDADGATQVTYVLVP